MLDLGPHKANNGRRAFQVIETPSREATRETGANFQTQKAK